MVPNSQVLQIPIGLKIDSPSELAQLSIMRLLGSLFA